MISEPVLLALISAGGPAIVIVIIWLRDRQGAGAKAASDLGNASKANAEGEASLATVTLAWAQELRQEITDLKARVTALDKAIATVEEENRLLRRHNELLTDQVIGLGGTPVPMPE